MEPKIKTAKELKIKAVEQTEQIEESVINDPEQSFIHRYTSNTIKKTENQKKARAASKRAKKARKINRK